MANAAPGYENAGHRAAREFGAAHPTVFGGIWLQDDRLHVGLTALDPYAAALRAALPESAAVDIDLVPYTLMELAEVRRAVEALWQQSATPADSPLRGVGSRRQQISVSLRSDAVDVARDLHQRFGDRVAIRVGAKPYPPAATPPPVRAAPRSTRHFPGLETHMAPDNEQVRPGAVVRGTASLRNTGAEAVTFDSGRPLTALLLDPAGQVAGVHSGPTAGVGIHVDLAPGETQHIPFVGGTDSVTAHHYTTPPGTYSLVAVIPVHDDHGHGQIVTASVALHVIE